MSPSQLETFPLLAVIYAISVYAFMLIYATIFLRFSAVKESLTISPSRYGSIDGLRGLLASGVFVHHSFAAYGYFTHGHWKWSSSAVLNQLGQSTVALFFMITGFLFTLKAMSPKVDWKALYISRIVRLAPLYTIIVCLVFFAVFILSDGVIKESAWNIVTEFALWLSFVCFGRPDINAYPMSWTLIAGVNWSLKYEIEFYLFGVPALYWASKFISTRAAFFVTASALAFLLVFRSFNLVAGYTIFTAHFLGGILTAYAFQIPKAKELMQKIQFKYFAGIAACSLLFMQNYAGALAVLSAIIIFAAIVGGASIFGVLTSRSALWLGDISYGIYLIHGFVLWVALASLRKMVNLVQIDLLLYWAIIVTLSGVIAFLASLSYIKIEKPAMTTFTGKGRRA